MIVVRHEANKTGNKGYMAAKAPICWATDRQKWWDMADQLPSTICQIATVAWLTHTKAPNITPLPVFTMQAFSAITLHNLQYIEGF